MNADAYLQFAQSVLSDLAIRRDSQGRSVARGKRRTEFISGQTVRVSLQGDHICYSGDETNANGKKIRGSDSAFRLNLAVSACERYLADTGTDKGLSRQACLMVAGFVLSSLAMPLRTVFLKGQRGPKRKLKSQPSESRKQSAIVVTETSDPRFAELDALIAASPKRLKVPSTCDRLARTVSEENRRYRVHNPKWATAFELWFGAFRFSHYRDHDWYARTEMAWRQCLANCEQSLGPYDCLVGHYCLCLGSLSLEQLKFEEAEEWYRRAWAAWLGASNLSPNYRSWLLNTSATGIGHCRDRVPLPPDPPSLGSGPRTVFGLLVCAARCPNGPDKAARKGSADC